MAALFGEVTAPLQADASLPDSAAHSWDKVMRKCADAQGVTSCRCWPLEEKMDVFSCHHGSCNNNYQRPLWKVSEGRRTPPSCKGPF